MFKAVFALLICVLGSDLKCNSTFQKVGEHYLIKIC